MIDLYRFTKKEYAEELMEGKLYMNTLSYFWNHGFEDQKDIFEGTCQMQAPEDSPFSIKWQSIISGSIIYRLEAYKYCNLLCFYRHEYNPLKKQVERFNAGIQSFGEYAVRIFDVDSFLCRLMDKAKTLGDYRLAGTVQYHSRNEIMMTSDCFNKMSHYREQKEWREVYLHDYPKLQKLAQEEPERKYEEPVAIEIGGLKGIAEIVKTETLFASPQTIYKGYKTVETVEKMVLLAVMDNLPLPYHWNGDTYSGWGGRAQFQNQVIGIDGGKQRLMFSM